MNNKRLEILLTLILAAVFAATQIPSIQKLLIRWNQGDNDYCFLIVPLFVYLCWDRRFNGQTGFRYAQFEWSPWGLAAIAIACGLMMLGEAGSVEFILYVGLYIGIVGIAAFLYGRRIRHLLFPLLVLAFIVPLPPFISRMFTFQLKMIATTVAVKILRLMDISVLQTGNIIDLGVDKLQVVDACSGLRYFLPMILLALLIGYFFNRGLWRRLLLLAIVPPLSIVVNALRIGFSGWLTVNGHRELAQNFFHDFSGWLVFMVAAAILVGISLILSKVGRKAKDRPLIDQSKGRAAGLMRPLTGTLAACLLLLISSQALQGTPSAANLPERKRLENFPMSIAHWQGHQQFLAKDILEELWADDYVSATYRLADNTNRIQLLIPFYAYQSTRHTAHAPQACLLGGGFDLLKSEDRHVDTSAGDTIKIRTLLLKQGNTRILSAYFFFQRGRVITSPWMNKFYLMRDAITLRRTDGALVRAELLMAPGQSEEEAFAILSDFLREIWVLLPDYVPT